MPSTFRTGQYVTVNNGWDSVTFRIAHRTARYVTLQPVGSENKFRVQVRVHPHNDSGDEYAYLEGATVCP
jgi:hypothetical protein